MSRVKDAMNRAIALLAALIFTVLMVRLHGTGHVPTEPEPLPVIVDVQGNVQNPGTYLLEGPSATVRDAIKAAGGVKAGAMSAIPEDWSGIEIRTGQLVSIVCEEAGEPQVRLETMRAGARLTLGQKLDINTATAEELLLVPQMRPEFAEAIVKRRERKPWEKLRELSEIPGIGPRTVEKWSSYLEIPNEDQPNEQP